ncbi:unnamed protein product [Paramecium primaurelia]|uniref:Histidine kinase domain-containing protein n=1 Tax=Paramecium primaurelia TaxID=5886 RepID=A0A8S1JZ71_PARPR|nr:unnamed protein product [Paramecium primaurelia]
MLSIKLVLPQILKPLFSIICIIYLQLRGQIFNLLIPQIIFLAFGIIFSLAAIRKTAQNLQQIDHSPIFFTILLLLQFASLLYLSNDNISENLLSLLFGSMLQLQKLKSNDKNEKKQFLNIKILLQAISLVIIFIVIILFKNITNHIEYFIIASILIILVCLYEFLLSNNKHQPVQIEQNKTIVQRRISTQIQSQFPQNVQSLWEKFIEQQYIFVSYRNNEILIEKMSQYLIQFLKEKNQSIEEYMKKIQLYTISLDSEHILTNNMFVNMSTNLYSYIRDQIIDEKQSAVMQRRKSQRDINEDQQLQKLVSPQNEQRSRLQSIQKSEAYLQKGNTLNLNNSSLQYIDREFLSGSVMKNLDNFIAKPQDNNSQLANKKQILYGIIQNEKSIYKKIQVSYWNQGLIVQIEDDSIDNIKVYMNSVQIGYKQEVTSKQIQKLSQMVSDLQQKFNKLLNNQNKEDKLFSQAQLQLYVLDIWINNFNIFLSDSMAFPKQEQVNIISFLKTLKTKFSQDTTVIEKSINIIISDDMNNKFITTDIKYFRSIIVNLLINSIKAYKKPDITNMVQIHVSQQPNDDVKFEIYDKASGFSQPLDFKRVSEGKLGIFVVQKLLPYLSKNPKLQFKSVNYENKQTGSQISFILPRQINPINNSLQNSSNNLLQQESFKMAQIIQSQLLPQQQDFI